MIEMLARQMRPTLVPTGGEDGVGRRLGLSQEELGFRAEVHRTYISQLERGLKSPTLSMILKLSRALKATASKLVATVERQL